VLSSIIFGKSFLVSSYGPYGKRETNTSSKIKEPPQKSYGNGFVKIWKNPWHSKTGIKRTFPNKTMKKLYGKIGIFVSSEETLTSILQEIQVTIILDGIHLLNTVSSSTLMELPR